MSSENKLVELQRSSYGDQGWSDTDLLPYKLRRDKTFGQYAANVHLIALEPFVERLKGASAITVCDGRGVEASYLKQHGLTVTATDLCPQYLSMLLEKGYIDRYNGQNAEALTYTDEEFNWGFVKAGLHHLPRPWMGLYELLRVSKEGVFVLEGHDSWILGVIRRLFARGRDWEESGNYVFRFKEREIEKVCLGLDFPGYAIKKTFIPWHRVLERVIKGSLRYKILLTVHKIINYLSFGQGNCFSVVIFKKDPEADLIMILERQGFRYHKLPRNPYVSKVKNI